MAGWRVIAVALLAGCSAEAPSVEPAPPPAAADPSNAGDAGAARAPAPPAGSAAPPSSDAGPPAPPVDPAFDARLKKQIQAVVGGSFATFAWDDLLHANVPFSGVKIWVPGTGEWVVDDPTNGRAMASVPSGLVTWGPAVPFVPGAPPTTSVWLGVPCAQSKGGTLFSQRDRLSALEVFNTAWPDALDITGALGGRLKGAWVIGHSAGALPALLAGLLGGAHRIDLYGVPSAVGPLDGDDGSAHLHTHPLDPTGTMGKLDPNGAAQVDLFGTFATVLKAGATLAYHDYASWPAPVP